MSDDTHDVIYLQYMVHDITWDSERQDPNDVQYIHIKHFHRLLKNLAAVYEEWQYGSGPPEKFDEKMYYAGLVLDELRMIGKEN